MVIDPWNGSKDVVRENENEELVPHRGEPGGLPKFDPSAEVGFPANFWPSKMRMFQ